MLNAFCVDLEDYFQGNDLGISFGEWDRFPSRLAVGTRRILDILGRHGVKATFFIVSYRAADNADLIREIARCGHEIASHGHSHRMLSELTPKEFQRELRHSKNILEEISGKPVLGYRAASWSLTQATRWAEAILLKEGIRYDSSVLPMRGLLHVRGIPAAPRTVHLTAGGLVEFPAPVWRVAGLTYPFSLATTFRLSPFALTARMLRSFRRLHHSPAMISIHPWELDPDQPRLRLPPKQKFIKYTGMGTIEQKLHRLLSEFSFGCVADVLSELELLS